MSSLLVALVCFCGAPLHGLSPGEPCASCGTRTRPSPQPQALCTCGKPTWNGEPGFCSVRCKQSQKPQALCICGKPTWDGEPGFCSVMCKQSHQPYALNPWGSQNLGGFSSQAYSALVAAGPAPAPTFAPCANHACPCSASWTGKIADFCSKRCRAGTPCTSDVHRRPTHPSFAMPSAVGNFSSVPPPPPPPPPKPTGPLCARLGCNREALHGINGSYCGQGCQTADQAARGIQEVNPAKFQEIKRQLEGGFKQGTPPQIDKIYDVHSIDRTEAHETYARGIGNVPLFGRGANPGNKQRRFHQSKTACNFNGRICNNASCATCSILKTGFDVKYATRGRFGKGLYSTSTSSKAYTYGNKKALFVVGVCVGLPELSDSSGALEAGKHSRVVRPQMGAKASENDDECVVFQSDAMIAKYLIVFK